MSDRYAFTVNLNREIRPLVPSKWKDCKFVVWQMELTPSTGQPHFQGYVEFTRPRSLASVRRLTGGGFFSVAKGTREENVKYCSKEDTRVEGPFFFNKSL